MPVTLIDQIQEWDAMPLSYVHPSSNTAKNPKTSTVVEHGCEQKVTEIRAVAVAIARTRAADFPYWSKMYTICDIPEGRV